MIIPYFTKRVWGKYATKEIQVEELLLKSLKYYYSPLFLDIES